ncbi:MAG: penicillin-binding protein 2 [Akkermansiaceae bacterium]|nr:penicillin-binding protein 2 [Akkermansiaceae bacterium]
MNRSFQNRSIVLCLVLVTGLSALSARLVQIQLVNRQRYAESSAKAFQRTERLPGTRGMIVDRHEEPLAKSIPVATVFVDKNHLNDPKLAAYGLAYQEACSTTPGWDKLPESDRRKLINGIRGEILSRYRETPEVIVQQHLSAAVGILARPLGMRRDEMREKIEKSKGKWLPIAKDLPEDVADQLREAVEQNWLQGFEFESSIKRWYTTPNMATHLIGYTGEVEKTDDDGKTKTSVVGRFGIEKALEEYLAGRDGWRKHKRDARGLVVPGNSGSINPPKSGWNAQLTLDMGLQAIVEEELDACLTEFKTKTGTIIMMDPKTGEVLAMANRPHFDLNHKQNIAEASWNYAIQTTYEPGSTIKIIAASAALNEGLVTPQTSIFCHNGVFIDGSVKVTDEHPAGQLTFEGILLKSNNIGTYKLARQVGMKRFYDYMDRWGFAKKTGILLSDESRGYVRNTGNPTDFSRACYGYATAVTPLQMTAAYSVIAGDGKLRKPKIVKALVANDGTPIQEFGAEVVNEVIKPATAKKMRAALTKVTEKGGTATRAAVVGFKVAGKTGTARKHKPGGGYDLTRKITSFIGMMPADDPAFVCAVIIDEPQPHGEISSVAGGNVSAPAFSKIAARAAIHMNLKPTEPVSPPLASSNNQ